MPEGKEPAARTVDLTRARNGRRWASWVVAGALVLGGLAAILWMRGLGSDDEPSGEHGNHGLRPTEIREGPLRFRLDLGQDGRIVEKGHPLKVAVKAADREVVLTFQFLTEFEDATAAAWSIPPVPGMKGRETLGGASEVKLRRFRWLDRDQKYGAWEVQILRPKPSEASNGTAEAGPVIEHRLYVDVPDGLVLISYELPALSATLLEDRAARLVGSMRWKG